MTKIFDWSPDILPGTQTLTAADEGRWFREAVIANELWRLLQPWGLGQIASNAARRDGHDLLDLTTPLGMWYLCRYHAWNWRQRGMPAWQQGKFDQERLERYARFSQAHWDTFFAFQAWAQSGADPNHLPAQPAE